MTATVPLRAAEVRPGALLPGAAGEHCIVLEAAESEAVVTLSVLTCIGFSMTESTRIVAADETVDVLVEGAPR